MTRHRSKKEPMAQAKKKVNLSAQVEESVRNRILNLEYPHNHVLVEEALCAEFGVSRSPVREALRMLEAADLIHKMNNRSYIIRQISQAGVKELYEVRLALERYVVEQLCAKEESDELVQLLLHWQQVDLTNVEDLAASDRIFHEKLARIYGNQAILGALSQINDRLRVFRVMDFARADRIQSTRKQHVDLLRAIHARDVAQALRCLEININEGLENALDALRQAILRAYER